MGEDFYKKLFFVFAFVLFVFVCSLFLLLGIIKGNRVVVSNEALGNSVTGNVVNNPITGFVAHPIYSGFSAPEPGFTFNNNTRALSVTDTAVYKTGYYSINGSQWTSFSLSGTAYGTSPVWLTGTATKTLSAFGVGEHYIIIYSCKYNVASASWNCSDNRWQLLVINNTPVTVPPTATCSDGIQNQEETSVDCGGPCDSCSSPALRTFYISQSGSDGNDGKSTSSTGAWKTLSHACENARNAGDLIHVIQGTHIETQQCQLAVGVSIEGDGKDKSIIKSSINNAPTIYLYSSSVTTGNQHISNIKLDGNSMTAYEPLVIDKRSNVEVHDCAFSDFRFSGVSFYGEDIGDDVAPNNFCINNKFYNNIVTNCAGYDPMGSPGNLQINAQQGMRVYNNSIIQTARGQGADGFGLKCVQGLNKDLKIYNNTIIMDGDDDNYWTFAMEFWNSLGGIEIYNNRIQGPIDLAGHLGRSGNYGYSFSVHDNVLGHDYLKSTSRDGLYMESINDLSNIIIYNNLFKNLRSPIILWTTPTSKFANISIYYNVFYNIGMNTAGSWGYGFHEGGDSGYTLTNLTFLNNVFIPASVSGMTSIAAIQIPSKGKVTNVEIRNNIIENFEYAAICTSDVGTGSVDTVSIENNIFYNDATTTKWVMVTPNHITQNQIITDNPLFTSSTDFHLKTGSPAINAGINVGLTKDFENKSISGAPDIGAYEK
jgi:hypothetical protein